MCTTWDVEGSIRPGGPTQIWARGVAATKDRRWAPGEAISVYFLEGASNKHDAFMDIAKEWFREGISLRLEKVANAKDANIRVAFQPNINQSYVGTENRLIDSSKATLNVADVTPDRVLHEFGHALGLAHEFTHPDMNFQWIKEEVYQDYMTEYKWEKEKVDQWVFEKFSPDRCEVITDFDKRSVMVYPIRKNWTTSHVEIQIPSQLSAGDLETIQRIYPA